MRLVLDTNVIVAALRSQSGASAELLRAAVRRRVTLPGGLNLALEYLDVCGREATLAGTDILAAGAFRFANEVVALLTPVEIRFRWRPRGPDPSDDHVVETALNGNAGAIVTFNSKDFLEAERRFSLLATTPSAILRRLEKTNG